MLIHGQVQTLGLGFVLGLSFRVRVRVRVRVRPLMCKAGDLVLIHGEARYLVITLSLG